MKSTPQSIKEILQPFLFPCREDKKPALEKGQSWEHDNPKKKPEYIEKNNFTLFLKKILNI